MSDNENHIALVYIVAPYTPENDLSDLDDQIMAAYTATRKVLESGAFPINTPGGLAHLDMFTDDDELWHEGELEIVRAVDAVYVTDGWEMDSGCVSLIREAAENGIPKFDNKDSLKVWLNTTFKWR